MLATPFPCLIEAQRSQHKSDALEDSEGPSLMLNHE